MKYQIDKTSISVYKIGEEPGEAYYWRRRTPQERIEAVEYLRQMNYGKDIVTQRLSRVLEIAERV